jgi:hypothetical protein
MLSSFSSWCGTGYTIGLTLDNKGLSIGEVDRDILLLDTWELTIELVSLSYFGNIESGYKGLRLSVARDTGFWLRLVEFRQDLEETGLGEEVVL